MSFVEFLWGDPGFMNILLLWTLSSLFFFSSHGFIANVSLIAPNIQFNNPTGVIISPDGVYALIADQGNHIIRQIILSTSTMVTIAGLSGSPGRSNGIGSNARFNLPLSISISPDGQSAYVADFSNHIIRKILLSFSLVSTVAGMSEIFGYSDGIGTYAMFYFPADVTISSNGNFALVADGSNHLIRKILLSNHQVRTLVGSSHCISGNSNGIGSNANFNNPASISISFDNSFALVADYSNHLIRQIILSTTEVITFVGGNSYGNRNGYGTFAKFYYPSGVEITKDGEYAFVSDRYNHLIRQIVLTTRSVTTLAGMSELSGVINGIGTNARFTYPNDISVSSDGRYALIADSSNNMIRSIDILENPTFQPTSSPSSQPTFPLPFPSSTPSSQPSISSTPHLSLKLERQSSTFPFDFSMTVPHVLILIFFGLFILSGISFVVYQRYFRYSCWLPLSRQRHHHDDDEAKETDSTHSLYKPEDGIQMSMSPVQYSIVPSVPESP
jgi:DNA-binding beta-propeller fold protein YncE